jgi:hypothetical protein
MKSKPSTFAQRNAESLLSVETMTVPTSATKDRAGAASKQSFMKSAAPVAVPASTHHSHAELARPNVTINAVVVKTVVTLQLTTPATRIANHALLARSWLRSSAYVERKLSRTSVARRTRYGVDYHAERSLNVGFTFARKNVTVRVNAKMLHLRAPNPVVDQKRSAIIAALTRATLHIRAKRSVHARPRPLSPASARTKSKLSSALRQNLARGTRREHWIATTSV